MSQNEKSVHLVIKCDIISVKEPCGVCGNEMRSMPGPAIYIEGTCLPVCNVCAKKYAPDLAWFLDLAEEARKTVMIAGGRCWK